MVLKSLLNVLFRLQPCVQVHGIPVAGNTMVERVDVIGPALEGLHFVALVVKGAEQSDSKGRLTASR